MIEGNEVILTIDTRFITLQDAKIWTVPITLKDDSQLQMEKQYEMRITIKYTEAEVVEEEVVEEEVVDETVIDDTSEDDTNDEEQKENEE